ncbi:MAG: hypothetical protein LW706_12485 [Chitinophagaceae bacterium]|nr:hypothetical protein [Chitinophagaceae bacterium]MCE2758745.1 hypothetical protein [Chitinophagaceae bacterium]
MWLKIAKGVLKYRWILLSALILFTSFMAFEASKVRMSYDFSRAIPTDHPKYQQYLDFKKHLARMATCLLLDFKAAPILQKIYLMRPKVYRSRSKKYKALKTSSVFKMPST